MNTIFLATVIGWYMVIFGLLLLIKQDYVKSAMGDVLAQRGLYFVLAVITLLLGLMMVATHNIWIMGWPVIITLFGWLVLIGGLLRLFCVDFSQKIGREFLKSSVKMRVTGIVFLVIGVYLLLHVCHLHYLANVNF